MSIPLVLVVSCYARRMKAGTYFRRALKRAGADRVERFAVLTELNEYGADVVLFDDLGVVRFEFEDGSHIMLPQTVFSEFRDAQRRIS